MEKQFTCTVCNETKECQTSGGTGYGRNDKDEKICYACIGVLDSRYLAQLPAGGKTILYLCKDGTGHVVSNWPGTFKRRVMNIRKSWHNIARNRYDFWFMHEGRTFHGIQYGDNTQIAHVKALKSK